MRSIYFFSDWLWPYCDSNENSGYLFVLQQFAYKGLVNIFNLPQLNDCIDLEEIDVIHMTQDECSILHISWFCCEKWMKRIYILSSIETGTRVINRGVTTCKTYFLHKLLGCFSFLIVTLAMILIRTSIECLRRKISWLRPWS